MKIKKIFAGMAASAIALSMMSVTASAYEAGIAVQNDQYTYRNLYGDSTAPTISDNAVAINGGSYGQDTSVSISNDSFSESGGHVVVSLDTSGIINDKGTADTGWFINEEKG